MHYACTKPDGIIYRTRDGVRIIKVNTTASPRGNSDGVVIFNILYYNCFIYESEDYIVLQA